MGEKTDALEPFHPDRLASRILGMGDVLSLVEKAQEVVDQTKAEALAKKLREDTFSLEDFRDQLKQLRQMGPLDQILGMLPFGKMLKGAPKDLDGESADLDRFDAIIGLDDAGRAAQSRGHQRQPAPAHRTGQRHQRAGRESAPEAIRAAPQGHEAVQGHGGKASRSMKNLPGFPR